MNSLRPAIQTYATLRLVVLWPCEKGYRYQSSFGWPAYYKSTAIASSPFIRAQTYEARKEFFFSPVAFLFFTNFSPIGNNRFVSSITFHIVVGLFLSTSDVFAMRFNSTSFWRCYFISKLLFKNTQMGKKGSVLNANNHPQK